MVAFAPVVGTEPPGSPSFRAASAPTPARL